VSEGDPWPIIRRASRPSLISAERAQVRPNLYIIGTSLELLAQPENDGATLQRAASRSATRDLAMSLERATRDLLTAARASALVERDGRMVGLAFMPNALGNNRLVEPDGPDLIMFNHLEIIDQAVDVLRHLNVLAPIWPVALPRHVAGHAAHTVAEEIVHLRERDHGIGFRQLLVKLIDLTVEIGLDRRLEADFRRILQPEALRELARDYTQLQEEVMRHGPDSEDEQAGLEGRSIPAGRRGRGARERDARERPRDVVRGRAGSQEPGRRCGGPLPSGPSAVSGRADAGRP
jgi:hypothetical protein